MFSNLTSLVKLLIFKIYMSYKYDNIISIYFVIIKISLEIYRQINVN